MEENKKQQLREVFLFPMDSLEYLEVEKNKAIKVFLNQLDAEFDSLISVKSNEKEIVKGKLRQSFLDSINSYARFSKKMFKDYAKYAEGVERLIDAVQKKE